MRTWGRVIDGNGKKKWVAVEADESGDFSYGWVTTLIQTLKLNLGESPFYAQYGIPAQQSVVTQIYPDFYASMVQQQFAHYFAYLSVSRVAGEDNPTYDIQAVFFNGVTYRNQIAV
ncbi:hypothetical protein [Citrobacter werkmanii]|uniref:hypothetical protein n=1 Tax=Citrobacter werkmanii TaxID=67827 RepID=UPI00300CC58D